MTTTRHQSNAAPALSGAPDAPRLHVVTFGCQMNKYDSELVEGCFQRAGYAISASIDEADVVLFNTCSVREHAEERTWSWVGELAGAKQRRPELVIGVMGCMAQRVEEEVFRRAGHVDLVVGTRHFQHLPGMVEELQQRRRERERGDPPAHLLATGVEGEVIIDRRGEVWRGGRHAFLAVMRGCDLSCSYCVVPATRGRVRSRPVDELVGEARWYVDQGVQVLTLLGQTVNSYGEDFDPPGPAGPQRRGRRGRVGLADLLEELEALDGLERIRLVTSHPSYVTRELALALRDCRKVDRLLPLPVQSGSDEVLKRMQRGYTLDLYRRRADLLREHVPGIELGSDWIVGFCGESEADFARSERFLEEQGFLVNYAFKYDPRPGTRAHGFDDDVPEEQKRERHRRLLAVAERVQRRRLAERVGSRVRAFVEGRSERAGGTLQGRTEHGIPIQFAGPQELVGRYAEVAVEEASSFGLLGSRSAE